MAGKTLNRRQVAKSLLALPGAMSASSLLTSGASAEPNVLPGAETARTAAQVATTAPNAVAEAFDRAVWKSFYADTRVWGYADRHSVDAGETFKIMLSTGPALEKLDGKVEIYRIGFYPDGDRKLFWSSDFLRAYQENITASAAMLGTGWPEAIDDIDTTGWSSGYYTIDFVAKEDGRREPNIAHIVVTDKDRSGDILVELSTNTYQAYNAWGGVSFYQSDFGGTAAQLISFDRPAMPAFFDFEYFLVMWLEEVAARNKIRVDYATNFDVHRDESFTGKYRLFVSGSHNEYWSKEEFDHVYSRIFRLGKNTIFMGANTAYWQVRYADVNDPKSQMRLGRQLVCYKSLSDPIRQRLDEKEGMLHVTARFRDASRRPEVMLTGTAYQSYFEFASPKRYSYRVASVEAPFFDGTGCKIGDVVADVVGYEWDNTDPEGDGNRLWVEERSQIPLLPREHIKVLLTGEAVDIDGRPGLAEAVYFTPPSGAKVFSAGSIRWAWGLGKAGFEKESFKRFNENLVRYFLA